MSTIYDPRYIKLIDSLKQSRRSRNIRQAELANRLGRPQSYVSKVERFERRIDVVELYDWLTILEIKPLGFFRKIGWFVEPQNQTNLPALPIDGEVKEHENGVLQQLAWQGEVREVLLEGISVEDYLEVERTVRNIYSPLNEPGSSLKNREAIYEAFAYAIRRLPNLNPSDIYQHLIYRLYLSWTLAITPHSKPRRSAVR